MVHGSEIIGQKFNSDHLQIKVAKAYAEGKHSFEEIAQLYGIKNLWIIPKFGG